MKDGKIYILPTRFGFVFLFSIVLMLLAGAIYTNNLVNLLAFFLLAIALVAMVQTHNNLKNVSLKLVQTEPNFADTTVTMIAAFENSGRDPRFALQVRPEKSFRFHADVDNGIPLAGKGTLRKKSTYEFAKRGRYPIRRLTISSKYPVGLFYSWMYFSAESEFLVYPARRGHSSLPSTSVLGADGNSLIANRGGEDFRGHRSYVPGDSGARIDWKAFARGRPLLVKEFDQGNPEAVLLDYDRTPGPDIESKLSQLALWMESAHLQHRRFALKLQNEYVPPNEGLQHLERCLKLLALFPGDANGKTAG
jgi:uncharacterized protein (DUF58 family)